MSVPARLDAEAIRHHHYAMQMVGGPRPLEAAIRALLDDAEARLADAAPLVSETRPSPEALAVAERVLGGMDPDAVDAAIDGGQAAAHGLPETQGDEEPDRTRDAWLDGLAHAVKRRSALRTNPVPGYDVPHPPVKRVPNDGKSEHRIRLEERSRLRGLVNDLVKTGATPTSGPVEHGYQHALQDVLAQFGVAPALSTQEGKNHA